jgi:nucleotide-binding universal stress UspA family protein
MFHTLVVPLDGSQLAERSLPYAVRLAQASQGKLVLMRAAMAAPLPTLADINWEHDQTAAVAEAQQYLRDVAERIDNQVTTVDTIVTCGRAADNILETIETVQADAVVIATHGRTGFSHLLYGSVTEEILSKCSVPVFAVYAQPGQAPTAPFSPDRARILVPQDGSAYDAPAVQAALNLLGPEGEIVLVTVASPPEHVQRDHTGRVIAYLDQQEEMRTREARDYLAEVARGIPGAHVSTDVRVGDAVSGIAMAATDKTVDLIVMATHGRTGVTRAVLGSVAGLVLRTSNVPVVLVHPQIPAPLAEDTASSTVGPVPTF